MKSFPVFERARLYGIAPQNIPGIPTKTSTATSQTGHFILATTPIKFPHLEDLNLFMRDVRLQNFKGSEDPILHSEKSFYLILDRWKTENPWPSQDIKFKNKKAKYRVAKASFVEEKAAELAFCKCMDYEFIVWTSVTGVVDVRCDKCFHLYPYQIDEDLSKTRNQTRVPYGQCAEALTCRRVYNISNGDDGAKFEEKMEDVKERID
jgi:hypothetical protein